MNTPRTIVLFDKDHPPGCKQMRVLYDQAINFCEKGVFDLGIPLAQQLLQLRPDDVKYLTLLGKALTEVGQWEEAMIHLRKAVQLDPKNPRPNIELAVVLTHQHRFREAKSVYEKVLALHPQEPFALWNLASCLMALKESPERTEELMVRATTLMPRQQGAWINLGMVLENQGKRQAADQAYARALIISGSGDLAAVARRKRAALAQPLN